MNNIELSFNCVSMQEPCPTFEYMLWFESLLFFGFEEHTTLQKDEDISLLPAIVEKVILSKLSGSDSCSAALSIPRRNPLRGMQTSTKYVMCSCFCGSVGRASVGPAVKQSDRQAGGLHSQTH